MNKTFTIGITSIDGKIRILESDVVAMIEEGKA